MKIHIFLCLLLVSTISVAQNECPECEKFNIVGVYDFGPPPGGNWVIVLLTVTEDLDSGFDPHYSSLYFVENSGDTITVPLGGSHTLPQITSDTIPYLLELNTELANQDFPIDFDGVLVIQTPTAGGCPPTTFCHTNYSKVVTSASESPLQNTSATIYPNPILDNLCIESKEQIDIIDIFSADARLIKSLKANHSENCINISKLDPGIFYVRLLFESQKRETHKVVRIN